MVVARDMFLKVLVFCCVVGLFPFFALEGYGVCVYCWGA